MRVVAIQAHGGLDQVKLQEWPDPVPGAGEAEASKIWTPGSEQPSSGKKSALWTPGN